MSAEDRLERAADELQEIMERYDVSICVDVESFEEPLIYFQTNEELEEPSVRLH